MKTYEPKQLNAFQKQRAPRQVSDESFADLKEQMADEGIFFRGSTYCEELTHLETGILQTVWFDKTLQKWIAEFSFPDDSTRRIEADSRLALSAAIAAGHAQTVVEAQEAELEANPVFKSEWERTAHEWMNGCKFGKEFAVWSEFLPQKTVDEIAEMIRSKAYRMFRAGAKLDARNIEAAYVELLDSGALDKFENDAANNKKIADAQAAKDAEQERVTAERQQAEERGYNRAMVAHEQQEALEQFRENQKLSKTKKGLAELRRLALFGSKENAFPVSTGTAKRQ